MKILDVLDSKIPNAFKDKKPKKVVNKVKQSVYGGLGSNLSGQCSTDGNGATDGSSSTGAGASAGSGSAGGSGGSAGGASGGAA
jgi:hypothetical protein